MEYMTLRRHLIRHVIRRPIFISLIKGDLLGLGSLTVSAFDALL
jgi:hypothetical protein